MCQPNVKLKCYRNTKLVGLGCGLTCNIKEGKISSLHCNWHGYNSSERFLNLGRITCTRFAAWCVTITRTFCFNIQCPNILTTTVKLVIYKSINVRSLFCFYYFSLFIGFAVCVSILFQTHTHRNIKRTFQDYILKNFESVSCGTRY